MQWLNVPIFNFVRGCMDFNLSLNCFSRIRSDKSMLVDAVDWSINNVDCNWDIYVIIIFIRDSIASKWVTFLLLWRIAFSDSRSILQMNRFRILQLIHVHDHCVFYATWGSGNYFYPFIKWIKMYLDTWMKCLTFNCKILRNEVYRFFLLYSIVIWNNYFSCLNGKLEFRTIL